MMQAAVYRSFGGPIRIEKLPIPTLDDGDADDDADDAILLQVMATGVCRSDWHGWKGHDEDIRRHGLPFVPGHEMSGIVVRVGSNVKTLNPGDRVAVPFILSCGKCSYCCRDNRPTVCSDQRQAGFTQFGSFAEYVVLPRADRNVKRIPKNVSYVQAAALGCRFTTAYRAVLQQGRLQLKDTIAIFGCGGVGLSCVMIAAAAGARRIIAVDVSPEALSKALEMGATHVVSAQGKDNSDIQTQVLHLTDDQEGAHVTVDAAGFASTCENAIWCTRRGKRMVQVGLPIDEKSQQPRVPMGLVASRELELVGSHGFAADDLPKLLDMVASGKLDPSLLVEQEVSLEEGARAIEAMDHGSPLGIVMVTKFQRDSRL